MFLELAGDKVALGNLDFLFKNVAAEVDDLHAVEQGGLYGAESVGSGDEKDVREVVVEVEVVVVEGLVLLGVEYFEQCRGGVAVVAHAVDFVNLVEDEDGVAEASFLDVLYDAAGHGADVGAAVATDFSFVVEAAECHTDILAVHGGGDAFAQRGLAGARRPYEAEDGALHVAFEVEHGDIFNDAFFDFLQAVMVFVEHFAGMGGVEVVLADFLPGEVEQGFHIVELYCVVGCLGGGAAEFLNAAVEGVLSGFGPLHLEGAVDEVLDVLVGRRAAQFVLDDAHLLVEVVFALLAVHLLTGLVLNVFADAVILFFVLKI